MHDGVWDRGDYIPLLFFKFTINFYEKIGPRGKWIFQIYFKIYISIFRLPCIFLKFIIISDAPRCTIIYQIILYTIFLKIKVNFLWKTGPRGEMNVPRNLLKLYIYIWNLEIRIWTSDDPFWKTILEYMSLLN